MSEPLTYDVCIVDAREEDVLVCSKPGTSLAATPSRAPLVRAVAAVAAAALLLVSAWLCFPSGAGSAARDAAMLRASDFMQAVKVEGCPTVEESQGTSIPVESGQRLIDVCFEPTSFEVEVEGGKKEFVAARLPTIQTHPLTFIEGPLTSDPIAFEVEDGVDHVPTSAKLPGGEDVPIMFSVKGLKASGHGSEFKPGFTWGGEFEVPSHNGLFLDPKARGGQTSHDNAVMDRPKTAAGVHGGKAVSMEDEREVLNKLKKGLIEEQMKGIDIGKGAIEMEVNKVNAELGEISGVFVSQQFVSKPPSDMEVPKAVRVEGIFYGRVA